MRPELAVTGLGAVSPVGLGRSALHEAFGAPAAARARAFEGPSTVLAHDRFPEARTAEVRDFDPAVHLGKKGHRNFDRLTYYLVVAAKQALEDAGVKAEGAFVGTLGPAQLGICSATAYGSLDSITELNLVAELEDPRYLNPARFPNTVTNAAAGYVSIWEDLRAPNTTVVAGNCGALDAVLTCATHLAHRRGAGFLVGGGDVVTEALYLALRRMGAIAGGEARWQPGERGSRGLHLGEGSAYVLVERRADAERRGARVEAVLAGYGTSFDPPAEGRLLHAAPRSVTRAIEQALADANVSPADVDVVASAVSGLSPFDQAELEGIGAAVGEDVPVAAPKALWGEAFAGGSALALASAVLWVDGAPVGPLVRGRAPTAVRTAVVTAVGYYGNVSAVVVQRP
ncbi:MAG: beta-ketoacyl synthase N-terminal-like domain-containing protein [Sandaracinaceae bacterium]